MCLEEATKCGQWFCWCHVFWEVIPSLWAGDRKSSATNSRQTSTNQATGADRTQRSQWRYWYSMPARQRCGRIAAGDRSTAQPHSALTGVVGPSRPESQLGCLCYSPNELAQADHQCLERVGLHWVTDLAQRAAGGGRRNTVTPRNPSLYMGSASPGRHLDVYTCRLLPSVLTVQNVRIIHFFLTPLLLSLPVAKLYTV